MLKQILSEIVNAVVKQAGDKIGKNVGNTLGRDLLNKYGDILGVGKTGSAGNSGNATAENTQARPSAPAVIPDRFIAFIDYVEGETDSYCQVKVISYEYSGSITMAVAGKTETMDIRAGQEKNFNAKLSPVPGSSVRLTAGSETRDIVFRYDSFQAIGYGEVENDSKFTERSVIAPALDRPNSLVAVYHLAETEDTIYGGPGSDTVWYCVSKNDRTTMADTTGVKVLARKSLKPGKKYYLQMLFFDDFNFVGGAGGVEITAG